MKKLFAMSKKELTIDGLVHQAERRVMKQVKAVG